MKILFTGGGTGGHFYPIIAVAEAVNDAVREKRLIEPELYYAAPDPYDRQMLLTNNIRFVPTSAGKIRRYFSLMNAVDMVKTAWGVIKSIVRIFFLYPDVVFSKGGYVSFPTLIAARLFRIPVVIHESDATPGRANAWAGKFAQKIAVSFPEAAQYFPKDRVAVTGNPIRKSLMHPTKEGAFEYLKLEEGVPVLLVLGGSQGATTLNDAILSALPQLVEKYQIIHQTGRANIIEVEGRAKLVLMNSGHAGRYHAFDYLDDLAMRMSAGAASLVISRAGSSIFEFAAWGLPSILVPIPEPISHDQTKNAFSYARAGAATVIEQNNLTPSILLAEIDRILSSDTLKQSMSNAAVTFSRGDSARIIADALLEIAVSHE
ncbi:MAG TPA: UDP-N-acetylglucosamine--N-acetylmuramyl-(pentapeptide) pyrophosphoryl-undecaprenol N-acetylglucosamine transferase [Candidatus Paceibacterota bacterium]